MARIQALVGEERAAEWCEGHVGILNVWRPIYTVEKSPLGFIDVSSVDDQKVIHNGNVPRNESL